MEDVTFQFPSNGKPYTKGKKMTEDPKGSQVFQFPSNGKPYTKGNITGNLDHDDIKFQFPSNGKPYTKYMGLWRKRQTVCNVSIPFKRETIYKGIQTIYVNTQQRQSFNSLQTGNHIQSKKLLMGASNAYQRVSIPFKRETIYKVLFWEESAGPLE